MHLRTLTATLLLIFIAATGDAYAGVMTTGAIERINAPNSVVSGSLESDEFMRVFSERSNVMLAADLQVDLSVPGDYMGSQLFPSSTTFIAAGSIVDSYFLHMDLVSSVANNVTTLSGLLTFDTQILGVIITDSRSSGTLDSSDLILGNPFTSYPTGDSTRGLGSAADFLRIFADGRSIEITLDIPSIASVDQVRIITAASNNATVPEPASVVLWATVSTIASLTTRFRKRERVD